MARRLLTLAGVSSLLVTGIIGAGVPASAVENTPNQALVAASMADSYSPSYQMLMVQPGMAGKTIVSFGYGKAAPKGTVFSTSSDLSYVAIDKNTGTITYLVPSTASKSINIPVTVTYPDGSKDNVVATLSMLQAVWSNPDAFPSVFKDVKFGAPFYTEINWIATNKIATGWSDGTYRPVLPVERGAMAAFFYRMAGSPSYTPPKTSRFKDVPTTHQFYKEISWLASKGITTGWSDGTFRPDAAITRDAMAAFFYRMDGKPAYTPPSVSPFKDVLPSDPFYQEISWMAANRITTGWEDRTYRALNTVNRDSMAAFIYRYKHKYALNNF